MFKGVFGPHRVARSLKIAGGVNKPQGDVKAPVPYRQFGHFNAFWVLSGFRVCDITDPKSHAGSTESRLATAAGLWHCGGKGIKAASAPAMKASLGTSRR